MTGAYFRTSVIFVEFRDQLPVVFSPPRFTFNAMTPKNILWALLALMFACGMSDALYAASHVHMPVWWMLLSAFLLSFLPYYWYRLDSEARLYRRPRWMSTAVVAMAPIGIPLYLLRSRPQGGRLGSLARMSGFLRMMLGAGVGGVAAFFMMPG
jgi:hypothetical protein